MSAIFGIVYFDGRSIDPTDMARMDAALAHYGPDDADIWREGSAALGQRMLWNTPESLHEKLPLRSAAGTLTLTADARIDNRDELVPVLSLAVDDTDSAVILAAYEKWGVDCVDHLLGDFAFAIWDAANRRLFCARDHLGAKPFYYHHAAGKAFVFASDDAALLQVPDVPRDLNELMIGDFLAATLGAREDKTATFYAHILRLPPAHTLMVSAAGLQLRQYWAFDLKRDTRYHSDAEYTAAFYEVFAEAVRCRLRTAYPVGSELSGGLDSSSVTVMARHLLRGQGRGPLHTIYSLPEGAEYDERPYVKPIVEQGGLSHHEVRRRSPLLDYDTRWWRDGLLYTNMRSGNDIYSTVQENGIRVLLNGWDGDTAVSHGTDYLFELVAARDWLAFVAEAEALSDHYGGKPLGWLRDYGYSYAQEMARQQRYGDYWRTVDGIARHFPVSRRKVMVQTDWKALVPRPLRRAWRTFRAGKPVQARWLAVNRTIRPAFAERIGLDVYLAAIEQPKFWTEREQHFQYVNAGSTPMGYEEFNRMSARYGFEMRYPFQDVRLIQFCLGLPPGQKLYQGWNRMIMRRAMDGLMPESVRWRGDKTHFSTDYTELMFIEDRAQIEAALSFSAADADADAYVDMQQVRELYERCVNLDGPTRMKEIMDVYAILKAVMLSVWLRRTGEAEVEAERQPAPVTIQQ